MGPRVTKSRTKCLVKTRHIDSGKLPFVISDVVVKGGTDPRRFPRPVPEKSTRTRSVHFLQCFQVLGSDSN